jgi:hypothetical protein
MVKGNGQESPRSFSSRWPQPKRDERYMSVNKAMIITVNK